MRAIRPSEDQTAPSRTLSLRTNRPVGHGGRASNSRSLAFLLSLCLLGTGFAIVSPAAQASRSIEGKITGFNSPSSVAFDGRGDAWITDAGQEGLSPAEEVTENPAQNGLYEYSPYPSEKLLAIPNTLTPWSYYILDLGAAVDQATEEVFVSQSNGRTVNIFAPNGAPTNSFSTSGKPVACAEIKYGQGKVYHEPYCYTHAWSGINSAQTCFNCTPDVHVAIDNSATYSKGRVYLSLTSPEDDVEAYDNAERPVDFPATASYISNNKLTGTPSGAFGNVENISVDSDGNLYVSDTGNHVIDEFNSTGTFVQAFPAPNISGGYPGAAGMAVDPTNGNVMISEGGNGLVEYDSSGNHLETITNDGTGSFQTEGQPATTPEGYVYVPANGVVDIFGPATVVPKVTYEPVGSPSTSGGTLRANVDPNGGGPVTECKFEYGPTTKYSLGSIPCSPGTFSAPTEVTGALTGLTTETTYHYRVVVSNGKGTKYGADQTFATTKVVGLETRPVGNVGESSATLNASFFGNGEPTTYYFEWGPTETYGNTSVAPPGTSAGSPTGSTPLSFELSGLTPYTTYHYRVVATNGSGTSIGEDEAFTTTPGVPSGKSPSVTVVHSDRAVLHGQVDPNGANTVVQFEYVDESDFKSSGWAAAKVAPEPGLEIGMSRHYQAASSFVTGLTPGTVYHLRVTGSNEAGPGASEESTFTTFPFVPSFQDSCPNSHVRQQTGSSLLLDCRGYELVSAANTGGFDVESTLVSGQEPYAGYPEAESPPRVLYGIHDGGISGTGNPTNRGVDPYVATRGANGWSTRYVGIPADNSYSKEPFSSTLAEADAGLDTFVFGGESICSPCFGPQQTETGEPIHLPNGELVQGMEGSIPQPSAKPAGYIGRRLSTDGTHFVFGSTSQFEPDGNNNGDISIYERDLETGQTSVVSKTPGGATMTGEGIGELDISADGSHVLIGQLVSEEGSAKYWHLYMNVGDSSKTIDLTPGTTHGVLFDGMTEDGSKVFFTTVDRLTNEDTDNSADIYDAEVSETGAKLQLISGGSEGTGNTDSCDPSANTRRPHWNTTGSQENCGVVAVGGGGGLARQDGAIFFLSPEKLDGSSNGVQNAPNLYVSRPGSLPHFVATLESSSNAPLPPLQHPYIRSFGAFENPTGVAIDDATGDVYVLDVKNSEGTGSVREFDASGHPVLSFGNNGSLEVAGVYGLFSLPTELGINQKTGDIYIPEFLEGKIGVFSPSGARLSEIETSDPTGVAIDQTDGDVYTSSFFGEISIYEPDGKQIKSFETTFAYPTGPSGLAVDSTGKIYVVNGGGQAAAKGSTQIYSSSGAHLGELSSEPSYGVAVDPSDDYVYVDEGSQVAEFDPSGNLVGSPTGVDRLAKSLSLAVNGGELYVSNPGQADVANFGPSVTPTDVATDNPLVVDSVSSPGLSKTGDFEITPSGEYAVFPSALPLTGYRNGGKREIYRYDSVSGELSCASCNQTSEEATSESSLPSNGLGLTNDGRVFFNSTEGLVDRDLNEKEDAYEWEPQGFEFGHGTEPCKTSGGCTDLISTGASSFDSSLLGVSADGTDAYFFTRDKLAEQDESGNSVKIYDARELGGFVYTPPEFQCKAADECHGPGSQAPPAPNIKSLAGTPLGTEPPSSACRSGYVKRHGKCEKKPHRHRSHRRHRRHRRG